MTTYVYETIPQNASELPIRFEFKQGMNDPKLTEQPGTGKPVRRLVSGGFALLRGGNFIRRVSHRSILAPEGLSQNALRSQAKPIVIQNVEP